MPVFLNASTSSGLVATPDNSGNILLQYNGVATPTFYAYSSGSQTIASGGVSYKVVLNTESWDTANFFDPTTNYRFTPTVAGYYQINMGSTGSFASISSGGYLVVQIYKNGAVWSSGGYCTSNNGNYWTASHSNMVYLNGTTDYVEMYINHNNNGTYTQQNQGTTYGTFMSGCLLRGA
jgi:hypothetical protein